MLPFYNLRTGLLGALALRTLIPLAACLLLLASSQVSANNKLLEGDLGLPSSAPDNALIDGRTIKPDPQPPKISPAQAAALVRAKVGGQVMGVNSRRSDGGIIYAVKVLNSGRMRVIHVDGQTGQLLNH